MSAPPKGPYTLVTVNNAPERAQRLVGRVVEIVKDRYVIKHVANAESMFCSLKHQDFDLGKVGMSLRCCHAVQQFTHIQYILTNLWN